MLGMNQYVHKKDQTIEQGPQHAGKTHRSGGIEDLRYQTSKLKTNKAQRREQQVPQQKSHGLRGSRSKQGAKEELIPDTTFYGPTAQSLDGLENTTSLANDDHHEPPSAPQDCDGHHDSPHQQLEEGSAYGIGGVEGEASSDGLYQQHSHGREARGIVKQEMLESEQRLPFTHTNVQGDSYPASTSGPPSMVHLDGQLRDGVADPRNDAHQHAQPASKAGHERRFIEARGDGDMIQELNDQWQFGQAGPTKLAVHGRTPEVKVQGQGRTESSSNRATINTTRQAALPINLAPQAQQHPQIHRGFQHAPHHATVDQPAFHRPADRQGKASTRKVDNRTIAQHSSVPANVQNPAYTPVPTVQESVPPGDQNPRSQRQENEGDEEGGLDYGPEQLMTMDLADLQNESFDKDPNDDELRLPAQCAHGTLEQKMATIIKANPQFQDLFLESLSLVEWEQAGDWFLGRFSDVVGHLKEVRQEKRRTAIDFEAKVKERHDLVGKKRKQIDASLDVMKESGRQVLAGTPQKKSKTK